MGLPCGPCRTVTWGMPMASSCTSPIRARRDLAPAPPPPPPPPPPPTHLPFPLHWQRIALAPEGRPMELIVEDAEFVTMAGDAGPAQAMLVRDGRIAAVGPAR